MRGSRYLFIHSRNSSCPGPLICNVKYPTESNIAPSLRQLPTKVITHDTWAGKHRPKKFLRASARCRGGLYMSTKGAHTWDMSQKKKTIIDSLSRGNNIKIRIGVSWSRTFERSRKRNFTRSPLYRDISR